jgi:DNA-binding LacI/PurR family transcriptional regulator
LSTIYDVAKLAGISPKTVSRVINEPHLVKEETRTRVTHAIKKLDYHPNAIAASLKRQRTNIIGFVVSNASEFVFQDLNMMQQLHGAHDQLMLEGYEVLISAPTRQKEALGEINRLVKNRSVDGVILYPSAGIDQILNEFKEKNFYYVTLGLCFKEQQNNFIDLNMTPGAYAAVKYLLSQGHRHIGMVNKPHSFFKFEKDDLLLGYQKAFQETGIEYNSDLITESEFTFDGGYQAFQKLKKANPGLSAVICASDPISYGVIKAITDAGLVINKDIEVITGDNLPITRKLYPSISSMHNPSYEQGKQAGKMIAAIISSGADIPGITLSTEFVARGKIS